MNTRLSQGDVFGGLTIGSDFGDQDSGDLNNPNDRINNQGDVGFDLAVPDPRRVQLPAAGGRPVLGIDSRSDRAAADAHLRR